MRRLLDAHSRDLAAAAMVLILAVMVAGYVLAHQAAGLPGWVPFAAGGGYTLRAELASAKAVAPGQGQTVDIAGVPVGLVRDVRLEHGRAVVTMSIDDRYRDRIHRDATILLRPRTGLEDMIVELDPGTAAAPRAPSGFTVPVRDTLPNVELDQVLAELDGDTRDELRLLLGGLGNGLRGRGATLAADFRRLDPLSGHADRLLAALATRRRSLRRLVHAFHGLAAALGSRDRRLADLVQGADRVFGALARRDRALKDALGALPGTLRTARGALASTGALATTLGPAAQALRPAARALAPALARTRPFLRATAPVIRGQLRPFARAVAPAVRTLRPAAHDLAALAPDLTRTLRVLNRGMNELAYNPPGTAEGYLFWLAWGDHEAATLFGSQDAHGPIRNGLLVLSCSTRAILGQVAQVNPALATTIGLLRIPDPCAKGGA